MLSRRLGRFVAVFSALLVLLSNSVGVVLADNYGSASDQTKRDLGIYFIDNNGIVDSGTCSNTNGSSGPSTQPPSQQAIDNAKIIMGIAKTENLPRAAALIAIMVGIDESSLLIYANINVPISEANPAKQADGSDHDSVGVFQQRPSTSWSTYAPDGGPAADLNKDAVWQLMDPAYAAEAFLGSPPGSDAPSVLRKGLQNVAGWETMTPWEAAQKVQASGTSSGLNYKAHMPAAQSMIDQYWDTATPVPLPVPLSGGNSPTGDATWGGCYNGTSGGVGGYVNPFQNTSWGLARTDQGVDYVPNTPLPVIAIGDGTIISTNGSGWPGGVFIYYKLSNGAFAGKCIYVAEHLIDVLPAGTTIHAGQTIATALPGSPWTEWGWAAGPQTPSTRYNGAADGTPMEGGKAFARFLRALGAKTLQDPGPGPEYAGNTCP